MVLLCVGFHAEFFSRAMPHFGQSPGLSEATPGHIGQKYFWAEAAVCADSLPEQQSWLRISTLLPQHGLAVCLASGELLKNVFRQCSLQK